MSDNQTGWAQDENTGAWYYYTDGEVTTGWKDIDGYTYYFNYPGGSMGWSKEVDGKYLGPDGKKVTSEGWVNTDPDNYGTWYYVGAHERVVTGWNKIGNDFHYFNYPGGSMTYENTIDGFYIDNDGKIASGTGWLKDGYSGNWYYYTDGAMTTGWKQDGDNWYYLNDDGSMATDWKYINGDWYYFHSDGSMATGWVQDKGIWYFLYNNGSMAHDYTADDGYHVDSQGKMVTGKGWVSSDGSWYYLKADGEVATGWLYDEGNWYYLYPKGSMAKNTNDTIDGSYVDVNGRWLADEDILPTIKHLNSIAEKYFCADDVTTNNEGILNLLRTYRYDGIVWDLTEFSDASPFANYINENYPDTKNSLKTYMVDARTAYIHGKATELSHLAATTLGYCQSPLVPNFWIGWGGDLATAMADVTKLKIKNPEISVEELATKVIGSDSYSCSRMDIENDIDAIYLSENISNDTFGNLLDSYFQTVDGDTRRTILLKEFGLDSTCTVDELSDAIIMKMCGPSGFLLPYGGYALKDKATYNSIEPTNEIINAVAQAFAKYILYNL